VKTDTNMTIEKIIYSQQQPKYRYILLCKIANKCCEYLKYEDFNFTYSTHMCESFFDIN